MKKDTRKPFDRKKADNNLEIYGSMRWRKLRKLYIPGFCAVMEFAGKMIVAEDLDHIIPINKGGDPWADENLMPMERRLHRRKTGYESVYGVLIPTMRNDVGFLIPVNKADICHFLLNSQRRRYYIRKINEGKKSSFYF